MKKLSTLLVVLLTIGAFMLGMFSQKAVVVKAQQQPRPPQDPALVQAQCIGAALSTYLKVILEGTRGLQNINILSPEFNLTSPYEFNIYVAMRSGSGGELFKRDNYPNFFGFIGNAYTLSGVGAYHWFNPSASDLNAAQNWRNIMIDAYPSSLGNPKFIFGEFGHFGDGENKANVPDLKQQVAEADNDSAVVAVNLFAAMEGSNPEFTRHNLSDSQINDVFNGHAEIAGENPGFPLNEQLPALIKGRGVTNSWIEMIANGPGEVETAANYVNKAHAEGYNPIIRACVGDSCGFADPNQYVQFIRDLSLKITGPVWIVGGPNEPMTEHWAAPACTAPQKPFVLADVPCNQTYEDVAGGGTPDFHSLRPYPASPCKKQPENTLLMCGQDLVVKDVYEFTDGGGSCETLADGTRRCKYTVTNTTAQVKLGLNDATFPIMGNTEAVPNSTNAAVSTIDFKQRVNEYVSWYLNGIPYRAEEKPEDLNTNDIQVPNALSRIINFGGPLKKLLPLFVQTDERRNENGRIGNDRHDQIAACGTADNPEQCYAPSYDFLRISTLAPQDQYKRAFPYLPFSSTEDLVGTGDSSLGGGFPSCAGGNPNNPDIVSGVTCADYDADNSTRNLYFAHIQEDNELGLMLQKTFKPNGVNDAGTARTEPLTEQNNIPYCEQVESRTNPGDKLYGELVRPTDTNKLPIQGTLTYSANFTCDFPPVTPEERDSCLAGCEDMADGADKDQCVVDCQGTNNTCQREVYIPFSVKVAVPDLTTSWERFVDGSMSIFKRIFPKVGVGAPVEEIKDIPGKAPAIYSSQNTGGDGALLTSQTLAGNPAQQRDGSTAEIYFPHIGSIYDYFLKNVQKALRPKGIEDTTNGTPVTAATCTITKSNMSPALLAIIAQASQWAHIPAQLLTTVVEKEGCGSFGSGSGLCSLTDAQVLQYSAPGAQWPNNCNVSINAASGPTQIINGIFQSGWNNAVNIGSGESRTPNNCNIKDSIFAAAWILSAGYASSLSPQVGYDVNLSPAPSSWTVTDMERSLTKWVNGYLDPGQALCTNRAKLLPGACYFTQTYCNKIVQYNTSITTSCNTPATGGGVAVTPDVPACNIP